MNINNNKNENSNFWILYIGLMSGLIFIFASIMVALIASYSSSKIDVEKLKLDLEKQKNILQLDAKKDENLVSKYKEISIIEDNNADFEDLKNRVKLAKYELVGLDKIKHELIKTLKLQLPANTIIDPNTGTIIFLSSSIFNLSVIKNDAKFDLRRTLSTYFDILLSKEFRPFISGISIEAYTDSVGSYLYNLDLSQKRSYEMLKFIYSFYTRRDLQYYLVANGRSFSKLIYKNGIEDKKLSSRIEIKFSIDNKTLLTNLKSILGENNSQIPKN